MVTSLCLFLFSLVSFSLTDVIHERQSKISPMLFGRPPGGFRLTSYVHYMDKDMNEVRDAEYPNVKNDTVDQVVDHFMIGSDTRRWKQRYFYNGEKVDKTKSEGQDIVFVMIGGEGEEHPRWIGNKDIQIVQYATQFGAHLFDLEHRFFGESRPINDMKTESLNLLTTDQALADLAYFINLMNQAHNFTNPKWVTFGGSYPGALSAFFRMKYPNLTVGAVASSAPVNLALDFYDYGGVIHSVMGRTPLPNNVSCVELTRTAFKTMQQLSLTPDGRQQLNNYFNLQPPFDMTGQMATKADINNFFSNIFNVFQGMTQYTYDGKSNNTRYDLTVQKMCDILNTNNNGTVDPVANIFPLIQWYNQYWSNIDNTTSFDNSYQDTLVDLKKTNYSEITDGGESRGWMWLCCNEIGYMQTTDTDTVFGSVLPISYFFDMCHDMFDGHFDAKKIRDGNLAARKNYGSDNEIFDATNVIFINGGFDPWHALGYFKNIPKKNIQYNVVDGIGHCCDMYPEYEGEPAGLKPARKQIVNFLSGILFGATPFPIPETTTQSSSTISILGGLFTLFLVLQ